MQDVLKHHETNPKEAFRQFITRQYFTDILTFLKISKHLNLLSKSSPNVAPFLKLMKKGCH